MKKVYIRAGALPYEPAPLADAIGKNLIANNSGNLIYQYSIFRTLMTPDTEFEAKPFMSLYNEPGGIERLNEECSCAILPLANAFRKGFYLRPLADALRRLKIPCAVIGCGLQAKRPEDIRDGFPFDDDVRAFVDAALDRSAMLGLRGEYTAEYLRRLGYVPERHFTVIGCPSLFMNGPEMPAPRVSPITGATRLSINTLTAQPPAMNRLIADTQRRYADCHLVLQEIRELAMLAFGALNGLPGRDRDRTGFYPRTALHPAVRAGRVIGFTEARDWFDYMKGKDYSFGSRLHGNLSAVVSGTPAFVFTSDTRTEEICRYGNVPHMPVDDLREGADIRGILEKADFGGVCRDYEKRFAHYIDFLNANGVDHIYRESLYPDRVPFDEAMRAVPAGVGRVYSGCLPPAERFRRRMNWYSRVLKKKAKKLRGK